MTVEEILRTELEKLTGLVGKVFCLEAPKGTKAPYCVYGMTDQKQFKTLEGVICYSKKTFDINLIAANYQGTKTLSDEARIMLNNLIGRTFSTISIQDVDLEDATEGFHPELSYPFSSIETTIYY